MNNLDSIIGKIKKYTRKRVFKPGEIIFNSSQKDPNIYFIISGKIKITKRIGSRTEKVLAILTRGNILGENAILNKEETKSVTATALEKTEVKYLHHKSFQTLMEEDFNLAINLLLIILKIIRQRLADSNEQLATIYAISLLIEDFKDENISILLNNVLREIIKNIGGEGGAVFLYNDIGGQLEKKASLNYPYDEKETKNILQQKVSIKQAFHGKKTIVVPLSASGILIITKASGKENFSENDYRFINTVASHISAAITILQKEQNKKNIEKLEKIKISI